MNYNEYEETIDMKEFFVFILRKWRSILLALILGAGILSCYKLLFDTPAVIEEFVVENEEEQNQDGIIIKEKQIRAAKDNMKRLQNLLPTLEKELLTLQECRDNAETTEENVLIAGQIVSLNTSIVAAKRDIDLAEINILSYEAELEKLRKENGLPAQDDADAAPESKSILIYAGVGALLGAFAIICIAFFQYFFSKQLRGSNELKEQFGIHIFGSLSAPETKHTNPIDRMLDQIMKEGRPLEIEEQYRRIAAGIKMRKDRGKTNQKILMTGTISSEIIGQVYEHLQKFLASDEFSLTVVPNPLYSTDAFLQIAENDILLIEGKGISDRKEVKRLVELLNDNKADLLGAVVI